MQVIFITNFFHMELQYAAFTASQTASSNIAICFTAKPSVGVRALWRHCVSASTLPAAASSKISSIL